MSADEHSLEAPGWAAIDRWVGGIFPGQTPHQFTSHTAYELDSPSPLPAITVWATAPTGWLYVTYGLSELFEKSSPDPSVSGFGFELSFRLAGGGDERPPVWPLRMLQSLGHHVLTARRGFDSGHVLDLGTSMVPPDSDGPSQSALEALICLPDPLLGKVDTVHGSLLFVRLFGVTRNELETLGTLELGDLVACVAELSPAAVTDPERASFMDDPQRSKILRRYRLGLEL